MAVPVPAIAGNAAIIYQLRMLWSTWAAEDGNPTADILRYTEAGGNIVAGVPPVPTQVAGLSALPCCVSQPGEFQMASRSEIGIQLKDGEREFGFIDLPAAGGVPANTFHELDVIVFEGLQWRPVGDSQSERKAHIRNDTAIGTSYVICQRVT